MTAIVAAQELCVPLANVEALELRLRDQFGRQPLTHELIGLVVHADDQDDR